MEKDKGGAGGGAAYLFDVNTGQLLRTFPNPTPEAGELFGSTVALDGNRALVGAAEANDAGPEASGAAYLFDINTGQLLNTFLKPNPTNYDRFGVDVTLDGNRALIGSWDYYGSTGGSAYLFDINTRELLHVFTKPKTDFGDHFGDRVALDGNKALVGAYGTYNTSDRTRVRSGKAYLFDLVKNDAPRARSVYKQTVVEGAAIRPINLSNAFRDPDNDSLTYTVSGLPDGLSFNPANNIITGTPNAGTVGTYTITLTADDTHSSPVENTFSLTVDNKAPQARSIPKQTVVEGVTITPIDLSNAFRDPENDSLTYTASGLPRGLRFNSANQTITGTPNFGTAGTYTITLTAKDTHNPRVGNTFSLTVDNKAPTGNLVSDQTAAEGIAITPIDLSNAFSDPENDHLTITASGLPAGLNLNSANQTITGTPNPDAAGTYTVTLTADDTHNPPVDNSFSLTVDLVVNIDATANNKDTPLVRSLGQGTYTVHLLNTQEGGQYDAWNVVTYTQGCDSAGENCKYGWETRYYFKFPYTKVLDSSCSAPEKTSSTTETCRYDDPILAASNAPDDVTLTLLSDKDVSFYIYDNVTLTNNQGGISLRLTRNQVWFC